MPHLSHAARQLGPVNAAGLLGLLAAAAAWGAGHGRLALVVAVVLGAGLVHNAVRLLALPLHREHLSEFVESWEHLTGREFGSGHRSDDVARAVYRQWRRAVRDGEAGGALGYLHQRASAA